MKILKKSLIASSILLISTASFAGVSADQEKYNTLKAKSVITSSDLNNAKSNLINYETQYSSLHIAIAKQALANDTYSYNILKKNSTNLDKIFAMNNKLISDNDALSTMSRILNLNGKFNPLDFSNFFVKVDPNGINPLLQAYNIALANNNSTVMALSQASAQLNNDLANLRKAQENLNKDATLISQYQNTITIYNAKLSDAQVQYDKIKASISQGTATSADLVKISNLISMINTNMTATKMMLDSTQKDYNRLQLLISSLQ